MGDPIMLGPYQVSLIFEPMVMKRNARHGVRRYPLLYQSFQKSLSQIEILITV